MTTNRIDATHQISTSETDSSKVLKPDGSGGVTFGAGEPGFNVNGDALPTETFLLQYEHLKLSGTGRLSIAGTAEVFLSDFGNFSPVIAGSPKGSTSFTVPNDYLYDLMYRLNLSGRMRATLVGTADLVLTDDFKTRQRIILAG